MWESMWESMVNHKTLNISNSHFSGFLNVSLLGLDLSSSLRICLDLVESLPRLDRDSQDFVSDWLKICVELAGKLSWLDRLGRDYLDLTETVSTWLILGLEIFLSQLEVILSHLAVNFVSSCRDSVSTLAEIQPRHYRQFISIWPRLCLKHLSLLSLSLVDLLDRDSCLNFTETLSWFGRNVGSAWSRLSRLYTNCFKYVGILSRFGRDYVSTWF